MRSPEGEPGLNYLCPGYKHFFNHVRPYMEYMAEQLRLQEAPANVMEWIHREMPACCRPLEINPLAQAMDWIERFGFRALQEAIIQDVGSSNDSR